MERAGDDQMQRRIVKLDMNERAVESAGRWTLAIVPVIALIVVAVTALWHLRDSAMAAQQRELTLLSIALTDEIDRGLQDAQEGLHAMKLELQEDRLPVSGAQATEPCYGKFPNPL
ncbi:MAG: hypothetical protein ABI409_08370, partial [Ramlibacter sp.]